MDILTFTSNMVQALAWPVVIFFVFWNLRQEGKGLLARLTKFEGPGVNAEFGKALEEAERKADEASLPVLGQTAEADITDYLIRITPWAAVLKTWKEVDQAIHKKFTWVCGYTDSGRAIAKHIPGTLRPMYEQLRALRNTAAHEDNSAITPVQAEDYVQLARRFLAQIDATDTTQPLGCEPALSPLASVRSSPEDQLGD